MDVYETKRMDEFGYNARRTESLFRKAVDSLG
jgi:hypothetical protein